MNSFQDLNFYSNTGVPFSDDRAYSITFSANVTTNSNVAATEGNAFAVVPGIEITSVISTPRDIVYSVNVASLSGATVIWPDPLPDGITANTAGTGIYQAHGVNGRNAWDQVKGALIVAPRDYSGTWTYSATITYPNTANVTLSNTYSWTNTVTVAEQPDITVNVGNVTYNQYATTTITPYPQIIDIEPDGIYTLVVSANSTSAVNNITSSGLGGNVTYNSGSRTYTIDGTRNQVNTHLATLQFRPEYAYTSDFTMYYTLVNPTSNVVSQTTQNFLIGLLYPVLTSAGNIVYDQDTAFSITSAPQLPDDSAWSPAPAYTITVTPSASIAVSNMSTSGTGGTVNFNGSSKVLTISGTRAQVNSHLNSITLTPSAYYNSNFTLSYQVTSPGGSPVTQYINIDTISVTLSVPDDIPYDEDTTVAPVPSVPEIIDVNFGIASETLPFTMNVKPASTSTINTISSSGTLGATKSFNGTTKIYSVVGNLAQISSELSNLSIAPGVDYANNFSIYYTLMTANGNVNANVAQTWLIGGENVETINTSSTRYYTANTAAYLFPNSVPQIVETITGDPTYVVNLVVPDARGAIITDPVQATISPLESTLSYLSTPYQTRLITGGAGWNPTTNTCTITGTQSEINAVLANVYYVPHKTISANTTIRFEQYRDNVLQTNVSISLIGSNNSISNKLFVYNQEKLAGTEYAGPIVTQYFTPTFDDSYYYNWDLLIVAGGGDSGNGFYVPPSNQYMPGFGFGDKTYYGGGGGAGGLIYQTNTNTFRNYLNSNLAIRVGPAVYDTTVNANTTIMSDSIEVLKVVRGGRGGNTGYSGSGFYGTPGTSGGSGGGGGAAYAAGGLGISGQGFNGQSGTSQQGGQGGGSAFSSNITGNVVTYSVGATATTGSQTPGSGGSYQSNNGPFYTGQPGIVVIKLY